MRGRAIKRAGPVPRTKPKAAPFPKCINGHLLQRGQAPLSCERCLMDLERSLAGMPPDQYRALRRLQLGIGSPPAVMIIRSHDGRETVFRARPRR